MKLAFADRAYWLGDPDFARVPRGLVDKDYAKHAGGEDRSWPRPRPSPATARRRRPTSASFCKHTTHIAAADAEGNWVAMTQTVNTAYGSLVIVPGTGVVLNNEMDDFAIAPGTPNAFGLVGAEANAVAPGKRPLSSMSPTIVLENGQPILTVGAAGGPTIITQVVQALVRRLDLGLPLDQAARPAANSSPVVARRRADRIAPGRIAARRAHRSRPQAHARRQHGCLAGHLVRPSHRAIPGRTRPARPRQSRRAVSERRRSHLALFDRPRPMA